MTKIIRQQGFLEQQTTNIINNELSNLTMLLQNSPILVKYYQINADLSNLVNGFGSVDTYIGLNSDIVYDIIENFPIYGIDNIQAMVESDDDLGVNTQFSTDGIILPQTITPKPGDVFIITGLKLPVVFRVTGYTYSSIKDNSFISIQIDIASRSNDKLSQLNRQIKDNKHFTVSEINGHKSSIITDDVYLAKRDLAKDYIDVMEMYESLFYDYNRSIFRYIEGTKTYIDHVLNKFMYDNNIIVFDEIITYAINNIIADHNRIFISIPIVDTYKAKISVLNKLVTKDSKDIDKYSRPVTMLLPTEMDRYLNTNDLCHIGEYKSISVEDANASPMYFFTSDMITQLRSTVYADFSIKSQIQRYFNNTEVDFSKTEILYENSTYNYYLIPIYLYIMKSHMNSL